MKLFPKFSLRQLLLLVTIIACSIPFVFWLRSNTILRSAIPGYLIARNGERYPLNRWFKLAEFDPTDFYGDKTFHTINEFLIVDTSYGKLRATADLWRLDLYNEREFVLELLIQVGERIE